VSIPEIYQNTEMRRVTKRTNQDPDFDMDNPSPVGDQVILISFELGGLRCAVAAAGDIQLGRSKVTIMV
jgi:hypothetical protein